MAKKKPLGKPLPPIKETYIDPAPTVEETDAMVVLWDQYAPAKYRGLLRAQNKRLLEQTGEKPTGRWLWDDQTKQYIEVRTGLPLPRMELHRALSTFTERFASR